ncbi:hypothetical protein E4M02_05350 [Brevundimonas sp. S30B]|uniref:hypothetical protein n=1 Tax=unclassified Brevundimonas TaxID=2622653 RepID=UPI001071BE4D|nr:MULTISPECIES: hypothetical protein [unclassified Brevundimonas]QBX36713.1 hypothetical protein E4M01_02465 [Brevundimonas sp. MF30-B]TFW04492.1 hypothetical protein E4M02_05350 [Brevundimonas sp. S30B]
MKIASLLAGVAVVALSATAVSAQSLRTVQQGQQARVNNITLGFGALGNVSITAPTLINPTVNIPYGGVLGFGAISNASNLATANNPDANNAAWHGVALSVGNVGTADDSLEATFSLSGTVTPDCAFYTGTSNSLNFDFGQIGVYASDNTGAAAAFTMVAPAAMTFDTNLAGCNTANTITIQKDDVRGLVNSTGSNYDTSVFQANLPYEIAAQYTAANGTGMGIGQTQTLNVGLNADAGSASHGAWKSDMSLRVVIPQAPNALLAGSYDGSFTVTIAAN